MLLLNSEGQVIRKSQPTLSDVHVSQPLTNISVAYVQDSDTFIARKVFPVVPVQKQADVYYVYKKEDFLRNEAKKRAPSTQSAGGGYNLSTDNYSCFVEAFHQDIDDQVRANADSVLQLDNASTEFVTQKLLIAEEAAWVAKYFTTGVWATDITPGTLWSAAGSRPRADVEVGKLAIQATTGFKPNTLAVSQQCFSALTDNAAIRDQFKYTSADSIDEAMMARYFGVKRFLIVQAVQTTGLEGTNAQTTGFIAGKHALLCYSAPTPSLMTPTAGYTFAWTGYTGSVQGLRMSKLRDDLIRSDRIEGENSYDQKVVASSMGYFFNGVVA